MKTLKAASTTQAENRNTLLGTITASLMLGSALLSTTQAQEVGNLQPQDTAATAQLEEITVTASRRDTTVKDINYNLSAISGETITELRILDTTELARWTPGLTIVDQGARQSNLAIIRGTNVNNVTTSDQNINTNGGTVGTFYGETPIYIDPLLVDMERVEVLRGPQGTLFGSRSLGGTLRYIPIKPDTSEFSTDVHGRSFVMDESDDVSYQGDITVNAPIIKDVLAFRGTLARVRNAGFIDYTSVVQTPGVSNPEDPAQLRRVEDANEEDVTLLRLGLLWNVTDRFDATLTYTNQIRDVGGRQSNTKDSFGSGQYEAAYRYEEPNKRQHDILQLDLNFDFGWAVLTSATGYTKYDERGQRDQTDLNYFEFPPTSPPDVTIDDIDAFGAFSVFSTETVDTDTLSQELRLVSQGDSRITWLAGLFYQEFDEKVTSTETAPGWSAYGNSLAPGVFANNDDVYAFEGRNQFREAAIYGQFGVRFTDAWQATIGGRWFDVKNTLNNCFAFPLFGPGDSCEDGDASGNESIFMFNTSYDFTDEFKGYITISEGYGLGGTNPVPVCNDPNDACISEDEAFVEPETVINYEVGARTQWLDNRLTLNAAVYRMDYKNIQVFAPSSVSGLFITKNAGKAESNGFELEVVAALGEFWTTGIGYTYNKSELAEDVEGLYNETVRKGDLLPGTPQDQFSWYLANRFPMKNGMDFLFRYGLNYTDDVFTKISDGNTCCREDGEVLKSFFVHNLAIGIAGERWEATLFSDNLTNEDAITGVRFDRSFIQTDPFSGVKDRRYYQNIIQPRTIGLDARYRF